MDTERPARSASYCSTRLATTITCCFLTHLIWKAKNRYDIVPHDFVRMSPGIALVTNGEDMGNYMCTLLNAGSLDSNQIFSKDALAMLLKRQGSAHPYSRGWSYAFVEKTISGHRALYKDGNGIGFTYSNS